MYLCDEVIRERENDTECTQEAFSTYYLPYKYTHIYMYIHTHTHLHTCIYTRTYVPVFVSVKMTQILPGVVFHVLPTIYVYTHIHIHIHVYTYIYLCDEVIRERENDADTPWGCFPCT